MAGSPGRTISILAILGSMFGGLLAPVAAREAPGLVLFTAPAWCDTDAGYSHTVRMRIRSLSYRLNDRDSRVSVPSFTRKGETIRWTASMAPGVYYYDVYGWAQVPGDVTPGFCSSGSQQIIVLPGDAIRVKIDMRIPMDSFDNILRSPVVFGVAPEDVNLRLLSFKGTAFCGSRISGRDSSTIPIKRDSMGYWSEDSAPGMALRLQRRSQTRYVRIGTEHPNVYIGFAKPLRLDVTSGLINKALAGPPDTLLCLSAK